jgi:hypothetical protein
MIKDIEKGRIGCIFAKDFSRFGRNFLQVGDYQEVTNSILVEGSNEKNLEVLRNQCFRVLYLTF